MSINGGLVNIDASHYSGNAFTSTVIPGPNNNPNAMPAEGSNIQSAASYIPCFKGGSKKFGSKNQINRKKINKISSMYKMNSQTFRKMKRRLRRSIKPNIRSRSKRTRSRRRNRVQKGGYSQYMNNVPSSSSYSTGGHLSSSMSALANPVPYKLLNNNVNCVDNYNHFKGTGFPSKGSF